MTFFKLSEFLMYKFKQKQNKNWKKMKSLKIAVYLCLSLIIMSPVSSSPNTALYDLNRMLFDGYDQYIIPVIDPTKVLMVTADFALFQIISIVNFYFFPKYTTEVNV